MNNTKALPLVWEFDGKGEWEAASQVMDPEMTDEPQEMWCKEWCLKWRIRVTEDGRFTCGDSDGLLLINAGETGFREFLQLHFVQGKIDLIEDQLRSVKRFELEDGEEQPITLLPADKYAQ